MMSWCFFYFLNILINKGPFYVFISYFGRTDNIIFNEKNNPKLFRNVSKMGKPKFNPIQKEF
jgi:hypothetical protein